ncbi:YggS family pyridoxal phosphate-dependent enzyme [Candidatus Woesearchaeota archaeon]|nr:YggS family pyridoxal phosphate-dependent enzyme [Candidatus Woesearchaeota archaeon]
MSIKENIEKIKSELPKGITLVAATKTRSVSEIKEAIGAGIGIIGENYVQEAEPKYNELKGKVKIHGIGHLQTNKIRKAVEIFDMIETVDSVKVAKEIDKRTDKVMPILIEVNIAKESSKTGVMPEESIKLISEISKLKKIKIKGLMTMAPYFDDPEKDRPYFKEMKRLFDKIKSMNISNVDMEILSMGMSDSYKIAIEEGATMVRIGTKIFGIREK